MLIDLIVFAKGVLGVAAALASVFAVLTLSRLDDRESGLWWLFAGVTLLLLAVVLDAIYWAGTLAATPQIYVAAAPVDRWQVLATDLTLIAGAYLVFLVGYVALRGRPFHRVGIIALRSAAVAAAIAAVWTALGGPL